MKYIGWIHLYVFRGIFSRVFGAGGGGKFDELRPRELYSRTLNNF
jgi:hypothetical protein